MIFLYCSFSLIISYHLAGLGFELFGLRVQVCSQLVQFTLAGKRYDNHHCHNKPQTGNRAGVWMTSCPEEMGRLEDLKKVSVEFRPWRWDVGVRPWFWEVEVWPYSWRLTLDHGGRQLSSLMSRRWLSFSGPDQRRWIEI